MAATKPTFDYGDQHVPPDSRHHDKYEISETYLSEPVRVPVTIVTGTEPGPTVFLTAAIHGDELNGVEVVRYVADEFEHDSLHGTLVCHHIVNVPGFNVQERYLPLDDSDLNRSFPGTSHGTGAQRIAADIYQTFIEPCDFGIDFHTSTRGRTNLVHVRGDMADDQVHRLAKAFASNVILDGPGPSGSLRRVATEHGIPTITVEMGSAHRFERRFIEGGLDGVRSVFAEFGIHPQREVGWPGWRTVIAGPEDATWVRADEGGIVEMHVESGEFVTADDRLCTVTNPFNKTLTAVTAPTDGLVISTLENPVVYPGNPLCHLVTLDAATRTAFEADAPETT